MAKKKTGIKGCAPAAVRQEFKQYWHDFIMKKEKTLFLDEFKEKCNLSIPAILDIVLTRRKRSEYNLFIKDLNTQLTVKFEGKKKPSPISYCERPTPEVTFWGKCKEEKLDREECVEKCIENNGIWK